MGAISLGPLLEAQLVIDDKAAKQTKEETQQNKQVAQINNYNNNYKLKYNYIYKWKYNYDNYNNNLVTMFNLLVCRSGRTSGIHASTMRWQTRRNNSFNIDDVIINPVNFIVAAVVVEGLLTCSLVVLSISNCLSSKRALQNCRLLLFCSDDSAALLRCTLAWVVVLLQLLSHSQTEWLAAVAVAATAAGGANEASLA